MCFCASFTGLNQARLQGNIVPNHFSIFMLGEEDHIFGNPFFAVRMIIFKDLALSPFYINNDNSLFCRTKQHTCQSYLKRHLEREGLLVKTSSEEFTIFTTCKLVSGDMAFP